MSKWNRPMRLWKPVRLTCARCGKDIRAGDGLRMVGHDIYHVLCAPQPQPSPELAARIARRRKS